MLKTNKITISAMLFFVIIAYSIMPIVGRIFSSFFTTYAYLLVLLLAFFIIVITDKDTFIKDSFSILVPLVVFNVLIYFVTNPSPILWVYELLRDFIPIMVGIYMLKHFDNRIIRIFFIFLLVCYAITAVTSIIGLSVYPDAARFLATVADSNDSDFITYGFMNIGGYNFVYSVVLAYPAVIYGFKRKRIHVAVLTVYAVLAFFLILSAGYTIALLLFIVSTVLLFFKRDLKGKDVFIVIVVSLLVILILFPIVSAGLEALADVIDNKDIADRLRDLAGGREGLENADDPRLELYLKSFNSFLNSPIFGGIFGVSSIGGHSFMLDTAAQYGILALIILGLFYSAIYKRFFGIYKRQQNFGYVVWAFTQTIILSTLNTGMWISELALFIPIIFAFANGKGK